ncbi:methyltransferase family protein [Agromyces mariniharenae]|uniref:methyltransferase family protein n=1 Tax=Agromyces mariniharenae TaxID=2604423 RepID=UPI001652D331|nr:methyltransferase [Agromyces mariniharenae]
MDARVRWDRGNWLVWAQFALFLLLLLPGDPLWSATWITVLAALLVAAGLGVAVAGFAVLGRDLVVWVAPKPDAPLRTDGIYRLTRNPIYLGLMIAAAGWVLWRARIELVVVWLLLCVVLVIKAHVEQRRLLDAFGDDYLAYAERTPLLLFGRGIR